MLGLLYVAYAVPFLVNGSDGMAQWEANTRGRNYLAARSEFIEGVAWGVVGVASTGLGLWVHRRRESTIEGASEFHPELRRAMSNPN